jgi:putative transposase
VATVPNRNKEERFRFIAQHASEFDVRYLCKRLDVSPGGYYKWVNRNPSQREIENQRITGRIVEIFHENDGNYGSPRVCHALRAEGETVNHKRVERIMRDLSLVGKAAKIYRRKALPERFFDKFENLRCGLPSPTTINSQWVGDVTYLKIGNKFQFLATVMDVYSRKIVGWALRDYRNSELTREALRRALRHRDVQPGLIFHTDRGSEYGSYLLQGVLNKAGIKPSMNRPGYMTDNAHMESFFHSMKTECIKGIEFRNEKELRKTLSYYIDDYYNVKRLHSGLGYTSPEKYEKMVA